MKTQFNLNQLTWNIKRMFYALQVMVIAMAIPLLSYLELAHVEKAETPVAKSSSISIPVPDATAITLK